MEQETDLEKKINLLVDGAWGAIGGLLLGTFAGGFAQYLDNQAGDYAFLIGASALLPTMFGGIIYSASRYYRDRPEKKKEMIISNLIDFTSSTVGFMSGYFLS